jgi:prepilin-type processing-associated H-X9-DG protein
MDGSLQELASGSWRVAGIPVGQGLSNGYIFYSRNFGALTDNYLSMTGISSPVPTPNTPVVMTSNFAAAGHPNPGVINTDDIAPFQYNGFNVRFRHMGNTVANALMIDGHVESFSLNPTTYVTSLLDKNIFVNTQW